MPVDPSAPYRQNKAVGISVMVEWDREGQMGRGQGCVGDMMKAENWGVLACMICANTLSSSSILSLKMLLSLLGLVPAQGLLFSLDSPRVWGNDSLFSPKWYRDPISTGPLSIVSHIHRNGCLPLWSSSGEEGNLKSPVIL